MFKSPGKPRTIAGSWRSEDGSSLVSRTGSEVRIPPELGDSGTVQTSFSSVVQDRKTPGTVGG